MNDKNFANCYFNNPKQIPVNDIQSFQSTLKAANEYCINEGIGHGLPNHGLPTSWP